MPTAERPMPVIVVSYNTRELLRRCLGALLASHGVSIRAIVVDNASSDGSAQMVRDAFPEVRVIGLETNRGFAAANNVALRELELLQALPSGGDDGGPTPSPKPEREADDCRCAEYVLLLNPDTEVQPDAVEILLNFMRGNPCAGATGAQLLYPDGRPQQSAFRFPGLMQTFFDFFPVHARVLDSRANGRYPRRDTPFEVDHPLGACILARGTTIRSVGLMDDAYFMYVEEVDWCRRIKCAGWQIWCEPRARIIHHAGQATRQSSQAMYVEKWRSRLRYYRKFYSPRYVALISAIIRVGLWYEARRLAREPLAADERARRLDTLAQVRALL